MGGDTVLENEVGGQGIAGDQADAFVPFMDIGRSEFAAILCDVGVGPEDFGSGKRNGYRRGDGCRGR